MAVRLGLRFPSASLLGLLYPIVQEVVVARKIGGIESHEEYNMLSKNRPDAEFTRFSVRPAGPVPAKRAPVPVRLSGANPAGRPGRVVGRQRQVVTRRGEENSVGYCADDGPDVAQEFITASSTDLHNIQKHNSVI
jgi:hypothetical protein